jgi:tyrosine-protein kinase Etk/Wzc
MIRTEPAATKELPDLFLESSEQSPLDSLIILAEHKGLLFQAVVIAAVVATAIAFLLPVRYEAKIILMPPQQNSSISSTLLNQLGNLGSLASLATGGLSTKNQGDMYVALLTSRTVEDAMIQRFGLMQEYGKKNMTDTRNKFESRTTALASTKDGLIRITVEDRDPKRAADLANGYVEEFRKLSAQLAISEAARRRLFFEQQLKQAKDELADAEDAMKRTQQSTGVLQIDSQARSLIESAALLRGQVVAKEVQIQGMRSFAAEDNPNLILAKQELAALQAQLARLGGSQGGGAGDDGSDLMLSKSRASEAGLQYLRRLREVKYRETVFALLAKEFEIAKLDEAREGAIIQVVDPAVPPDKRSFPPRLLLILGTTLIAGFLASFWIILRARMADSLNKPNNRHRMQVLKRIWNGRTAAA